MTAYLYLNSVTQEAITTPSVIPVSELWESGSSYMVKAWEYKTPLIQYCTDMKLFFGTEKDSCGSKLDLLVLNNINK